MIPARAGFTRSSWPWTSEVADHPRSRGVYSPMASALTFPSGSSPLARGLHAPAGAQGGPSGIIPARAGFTRRPPVSRPASADHPRSRGVYFITLQCLVHHRGIIPARAGFTLRPSTRLTVRTDHPRSRGVYHFPVPGTIQETGSSPLARGLLTLSGPLGQVPGIIPARAGFTLPPASSPTSSPDHPRSRGVYDMM